MDDSLYKWCCNCKYFCYLAYDDMRQVCSKKKPYKTTGWKKSCSDFLPSVNYKGDWQVSLFE